MVASRIAWDPRRLAPPAVAAVLAAVYLIWQPPSLDLAAAEYRAWLFGHAGFAVWDAQWYGGHHLPGYSILFPPLAYWLGPRVVGALAVVAAAILFERIAHTRYGERAWLGATWFAAGAVTTLFSGRLTFVLGLVPALAALLALQRSTTRERGTAALALAIALALLTPLASPVAALFLALAGTAYALGERRASGMLIAGAALAPVAALAVAFPEGGIEPFAFSSFWPVLAFAAVALVLVSREERTLRIGVVLYVLGCTAAFVLDTPIGGNVVRLGALTAGPLAALVLWPQRRTALLLLAPFLLWWQWTAAVNDVRTASGDPSVHAAYYAPLLTALDRAGAQGGATGRIEIPFTRLHWEARHVAPTIPLARGWERQLDLEVNPLFYGDQTNAPPLTPVRYRAWLDRMAVRWVAVPDLRLDYSAQDEARLIAHGLPYLRLVWHGVHWQLYEVTDPKPLADTPARVLQTDTDSLALAVPRPATIKLRVRWTPYWAVTQGDACVEPDGDWTQLRVRRAGTIRLATRFSLDRIGSRAARCGDRIVVNSG
ncbi:MAG TPA: hypothetical protein VGO48_03015 [Conexibacter sp.]|jgi:hypothetical protein|nr:hypothetical protein [Conexibacter sp.]